MTIDSKDETDTPIHSSGYQSRTIQKQKQIPHHIAVDSDDEIELTLDSYIEIIKKPGEDAEAELGQLC